MRVVTWGNALQSSALQTQFVAYLAVGSTTLGDIFDLHDLANCQILIGKCDWGDPDLGDTQGGGGGAGMPAGQQDGYRLVKLGLRLSGGNMQDGVSMDALAANRALIEQKLVQAEDAWNPTAKYAPVCLVVSLPGSTRYGYLDVMKGKLTEAPTAFGASYQRDFTLELTCAKFWRADPVWDAPVALTDNGVNATLYRAGVFGDGPALNHTEILDLSGSGLPSTVTGVHIARKSRYNRFTTSPAADFTPIVPLAPYTGQAGAAGAYLTDAAAMNGRCVRVTPGQAGQFFASATSPGGVYDHGRFDVYLRVRDSTPRLMPPTFPTPTVVTLPGTAATQQWAIAGKNAAGSLGAAAFSTPLACAASTSTFLLSPTLVAGSETPTNWRIFVSLNFGAWVWQDVSPGSAPYTTSYNLVLSGANPSAAPPTATQEAISTTGITPYYGVAPAAAIAGSIVALGQAGSAIFPAVGCGQWEYIWLGTLSLPPQAHQQLARDLLWMLNLYAQRYDAQTTTLDVDGIVLAAADNSDQAQCQAIYNPSSPQQALTFVFDTRSDGRFSAYAKDPTTGGVATLLIGSGDNTLGQGDNTLVYRTRSVTAAGQVVHSVASRIQVQNTWTPRGRGLPGLSGGKYL